jgi:REP element-mobilizing transposase RayT
MKIPQVNTTNYVPLKSRGELPHLYKDGGTYFVTFRLFDAVVPSTLRASNHTPIDGEDLLEDPVRLLSEYDPPIQMGSCLLAQPSVAQIVHNAILHFNGDRYELVAWCVMPNHVHTVFAPLRGFEPNGILHSWKSYTSHAINKLLKRSGTLWERESFDHLVRSARSLELFVRYTEENPVAAGLCRMASEWAYSSASCIGK